MSWQPIETAPKDGTRVDLWVKAWQPYNDTFAYQRCTNCYWTKGDSFANYGPRWINLDTGWFPTHWMPLPDPPVAASRAPETRP